VGDYILKLANNGLHPSFRNDEGFAQGLNVYQGKIVYRKVAESLRLPSTSWKELF